MKLQAKINLTIALFLIFITVSFLFIGIKVINELLYKSYKQLITSKLSYVANKIDNIYHNLEKSSSTSDYVKKSSNSNSRSSDRNLLEKQLIIQFTNFKFARSGHLFILKDSNKVIFHTDFKHNQAIDNTVIKNMFEIRNGEHDYDYQGSNRFCLFQYNPKLNWIIALSITKEEMYEQKNKYINYILLMVLLLSLFFILVRKFIKKYLGKLSTSLVWISEVEEGTFQPQTFAINPKDDFGILQHKLNSLLTKIKEKSNYLQKNEERFNLLSEATAEGIIIHKHGKIIDTNMAILKSLGYEASELIGKNVLDYIEVPQIESKKDEKILFEKDKIFEVRGLRKDQSTFPIEMINKEINYHGNLANITLLKDISYRKEKEQLVTTLDAVSRHSDFITKDLQEKIQTTEKEKEQLIKEIDLVTKYSDLLEKELLNQIESTIRESEKRFRVISETIPIPIIITRKSDNNIVFANEPSCTFLDHGIESLLKHRFMDFFDQSEYIPMTNVLAIYGNLSNYELKGRNSNDQSFWVALSIQPLIFNDEACLLNVLFDISQRKSFEMSLKERSDYLNELVSERTQELRKANQELKQLDEMKTNFLSTVSHELRTPLTSMIGFAKIIKKKINNTIFPEIKSGDKKVDKAVNQVGSNINIIVSEGERLTGLINNVLDIAKMEAGKIEWKSDPINIDEIIDRAISATSALFNQKDIEMMQELEDNLPVIEGDQDRLIQVVINLISNAVKFTNNQIICKARRHDNEIIVSIIDNGIGVASEDQPKVFDKFKQVGDTLTDKPIGTGLGLPICKEILEHHGGKIWLESELNKGCNFSFTLPAKIETSPDSKLAAIDEVKTIKIDNLLKQLESQVQFNKQSSTDKEKKTVLVVDDDPSIRELLKQELQDAGYHVREAKDGKDALIQVKNEKPDLITLDVMMPELNGFDVANILKTDTLTMDIPIIMLSIVEDQKRGYRLGIDRYLSKPIDTEKLHNEVNNLISREKLNKKILIVDENEITVQTLSDKMKAKGYEVVELYQVEDCIDRTIAIKPDIIIIDGKLSEKHNIIKTLRFEKGFENILFFLLGEVKDENQS